MAYVRSFVRQVWPYDGLFSASPLGDISLTNIVMKHDTWWQRGLAGSKSSMNLVDKCDCNLMSVCRTDGSRGNSYIV